MARYVIALDQGTTSSRTVLIDAQGHMVDAIQRPFQQIYPQPGWVEHSPYEIAQSQLGTFAELVARHNLEAEDIAGIGITNQRETTLVWNKNTGKPIANAIVWQCRRTAELVERLCGDEAVAQRIRETTGLVPDAYFSASKIAWLLDNVEGARKQAEAGELLFGTVDSWLIWTLSGGKVHATDATNASRTMLYDIHKGAWDPWLLDLFNIPVSMMPKVHPSAYSFAVTDFPGIPAGVPICGVAGDQQAALFGQCCFEAGQAKNTYGTGSFLLMHTGTDAPLSQNNLVTTIAASSPNTQATEYALEGSVFVSGAVMQWMRDEMDMIQESAESEYLAASVEDSAGVYIVPAFTGLGAPYWNPDARGIITGLTRGATRAHVVRAGVEAMAYQLQDLLGAMQADAGRSIEVLNVDGGAAANDFLLQFQADISRLTIRRPANTETTALGAAFLAGLTSGFWKNTDELKALREADDVFGAKMDPSRAQELLAGWKDAVSRAL